MTANVGYVVGQTEPPRIVDITTRRIERALAAFEPITLAEMDAVALLDRVDTKYVLRAEQLYTVLRQIAQAYRALEIKGTRLNHYQTLYFDTPDLALYRQHHNGCGSRYKVRERKYIESDLAFFEVKRRTNQDRTVKSRLQIPDIEPMLDHLVDECGGADPAVDVDGLEPKLWNEFQRITLVSTQQPERLTLDLNLRFAWGDAIEALPGIAIAEVKQAQASQPSAFVQQMRGLGIRPTSFSKYCVGICMLYDGVKTNNFKSRLRLVNKLMQEEVNHG
ncbi:MAG TPA: polyphosphate polymerase domain-containing protein [Aggregatilinea sp.]|uniref:polyphosphate polymerase domain-containing protein n=1 Tax=Aggregatilinea sp. TaxID=2806333 RepID=UPI002B936C55|nr:polyphosphate polymerase domain-containing protein [Aggregatilinea sp.]HML22271.1 polyphosphate polymerase domain-containing protein [Aggregatilinea sp.]